MVNEIFSPVRWVGGKRSLATQIMKKIPLTIQTYVEPFLGGGTIFIEILKEKRAQHYIVSDINSHVISMWSDIRDNYHQLIEEIHILKNSYDILTNMDSKREKYYFFRTCFNSMKMKETSYQQSALFMVLNKTAFNALVRYNSKGGFNSAFGKRETVKIDFENLDCLHDLLNTVNITFCTGDFTLVEQSHQWGIDDFVYLDPPYHELGSRKMDDKTYSQNGFYDADEQRMRHFCDRIVLGGGRFLMSNHECPEILEYFKGYLYKKLETYKCFTGKTSSRKSTSEILLGNY